MPDGDKFERRLPGKAWRQAYRLACRKEDFNELVRLVRNATEQDLRNGLACPKLEEITSLVHKALGNPLFASFDSIDRECELTQQLDAIAASQLSYPGTRLAIDAAKSVYAKQEFPALIDVVSEVCQTNGSRPEEVRFAFLRLYSQYVNEWDSFSARKLLTRQTLAA